MVGNEADVVGSEPPGRREHGGAEVGPVEVAVQRPLSAVFEQAAGLCREQLMPVLRERLHQAMEHAREQAARRLPDAEGRA